MEITYLKTNGGNDNGKQIVITEKGIEKFFSYSVLIGKRESGCIYLTDFWDYSSTTLAYCKQWLGTDNTKKEIQQQIDNGTYKRIK